MHILKSFAFVLYDYIISEDCAIFTHGRLRCAKTFLALYLMISAVVTNYCYACVLRRQIHCICLSFCN